MNLYNQIRFVTHCFFNTLFIITNIFKSCHRDVIKIE